MHSLDPRSCVSGKLHIFLAKDDDIATSNLPLIESDFNSYNALKIIVTCKFVAIIILIIFYFRQNEASELRWLINDGLVYFLLIKLLHWSLEISFFIHVGKSRWMVIWAS